MLLTRMKPLEELLLQLTQYSLWTHLSPPNSYLGTVFFFCPSDDRGTEKSQISDLVHLQEIATHADMLFLNGIYHIIYHLSWQFSSPRQIQQDPRPKAIPPLMEGPDKAKAHKFHHAATWSEPAHIWAPNPRHQKPPTHQRAEAPTLYVHIQVIIPQKVVALILGWRQVDQDPAVTK